VLCSPIGQHHRHRATGSIPVSDTSIAARITRSDDGVELRHVDASGADQVVQLIQELGSVADVLIEVEHSGRGALLIGLDGSRATIGLDSLEGVYQYSRRNAPPGHAKLVIGGQPTDVDLRYVLDTATAGEVARAWFAGDALPALGEWERADAACLDIPVGRDPCRVVLVQDRVEDGLLWSTRGSRPSSRSPRRGPALPVRSVGTG
jgi:hypothetical protein